MKYVILAVSLIGSSATAEEPILPKVALTEPIKSHGLSIVPVKNRKCTINKDSGKFIIEGCNIEINIPKTYKSTDDGEFQ